MRRPHSYIWLAVAALSLPLAACGIDDSKDFRFTVYPVSGTVVANGKPVPRAIVRFHPLDPAIVQFPPGKEGPPVVLTTETGDDGKYSLSTYLADDGVPAGPYADTVGTPLPATDIENSDTPAKPAPRSSGGPSPKYRDPATTPLKASVKSGVNHFDFELD